MLRNARLFSLLSLDNRDRTMQIKKSFLKKVLYPFVLITFFLTACDHPTPVDTVDSSARPALIYEVQSQGAGAKLRFPGRVRAVERAELSFNVPGYLADFALREGFPVSKGQVVAMLEQRVFKARVSAAKAEFNRAKTDYERYKGLWETEKAVARSEVDDRFSRLEVAKTNLAAAEQDLADTVIRAPFDGVITRRRVETYASVQSKQPVADLQNLKSLEVVINVPEKIFRTERPRKYALAIFEGNQTAPIDLTLRSYTTEADLQTQTYEVVLTIDHLPKGISLLPGMPVTVLPFIKDHEENKLGVWIPLSAVAVSTDQTQFVWVVDQNGSVSQRSIQTGEVRGGDIEVKNGLVPKEKIVAAGIHALKPGMIVRPIVKK